MKITDLNAVDLPAAGRKIALIAQDQNRDVLLLPVPLNVSPDGVGELIANVDDHVTDFSHLTP